MDTLRSAAHLQRELGDELFSALVSSDNTGKVRDFAETLMKPIVPAVAILPTEMTVGNVTYEILSFLKEGEESVKGNVMVERAKEMNANLGQEDCQHILNHQSDIPSELRGKALFVFTDWRRPGDSEGVAYVGWNGGRWVQNWYWLGDDWYGNVRVLRRK